MSTLIQRTRRALAVALLALLPLLASAAGHPGQIDFDSLPALGDADATVDIRLGGWMMNLARAAAEEGDEDLQFLAGIDTIRVRVFEVNGNADSFRAQAEDILDELNHRGWEEFARIRSSDELVFIMVKGDERRLQGITVVAVDSHDEAVFVNIAGSIDPKDVARIIDDEDLIHANIDLGP